MPSFIVLSMSSLLATPCCHIVRLSGRARLTAAERTVSSNETASLIIGIKIRFPTKLRVICRVNPRAVVSLVEDASPRSVSRSAHRFPAGFSKSFCSFYGVFVGLKRSYELNELHHRNRIEPMQANNSCWAGWIFREGNGRGYTC